VVHAPRLVPGVLPVDVERCCDAALVAEFTVVARGGRPVTYPMIPLYDGRRIFLTSSVLFSRKLAHLRADPRVCLAISDPVALRTGPFARTVVVGDARIVDEDLHHAWEPLLELWREKEPAIDGFVRKRFALPLFFERAVIEITPRRSFFWADGDTTRPPRLDEARPVTAAGDLEAPPAPPAAPGTAAGRRR